MKSKLLIILALAALLSGCTSTRYSNGNVTFERTAFLTKNTISELEIDATTGKAKIKGYSNEQTEVAVAVAQAVAQALAPAAAAK